MGEENPKRNPNSNTNPTRFETQSEDDPIPPDPLLDPGTFIHVDANDYVSAPAVPIQHESDSDVIDLSEVIDGQSLNDVIDGHNLTDLNGGHGLNGGNMTEVIDAQSSTGGINGQNMSGVIDGQNSTGQNSTRVIDGQSLTPPRGLDGENLKGVIDGQSVKEEGINGNNLKDVSLTEVIDGESLSLSETKKNSNSNSKKRLPVELAGRPDWLPDDWRYEIRMRVSGATAGSYDRYYFSPTGKNFRSRAEVLRFLETGSRKKKRGSEDETPPASSEKPKAKKPKRKKGDFSNVDFDYKNPPKNVSWNLTNASHDIWTPIADEVLTPESVQRTWEDAFSCITELESKK